MGSRYLTAGADHRDQQPFPKGRLRPAFATHCGTLPKSCLDVGLFIDEIRSFLALKFLDESVCLRGRGAVAPSPGWGSTASPSPYLTCAPVLVLS